MEYESLAATGTAIIAGATGNVRDMVLYAVIAIAGLVAVLIGIGFAFKKAKSNFGGGKKSVGM